MTTLPRRLLMIAVSAYIGVVLSGCGQQGPLYLPEEKSAAVPVEPVAPPAAGTPDDEVTKDAARNSQVPASPPR